MSTTKTLWIALATLSATASAACATNADDDASAGTLASEVQEAPFANATLGVGGFSGEADGCQDQYRGTADDTCPYDGETGPTSVGYVTELYQLNNKATPAREDGFEIKPSARVAARVVPTLDRLASRDGQRVKVRLHRIVSEGLTDGEVGDAPKKCADFGRYFVRGKANARWMPRIERLAVKLGGTRLSDGDDIGDDGLLMTEVCGLTLSLYQQSLPLTWISGGAYVGTFSHPQHKDGSRFAAYSHGSYQVDFFPEQRVSMPDKASPQHFPTAFTLALAHDLPSSGVKPQ